MSVSGAEECAQVRTELGVYVVGAIEPRDRARVQGHAASCARCRDELAGLAGLPGLLRKIAADEAVRAWMDEAAGPLPGPPPQALPARVRKTRRWRGWRPRWPLLCCWAWLRCRAGSTSPG
jgi:anti-sigma factor RsiW